MHLARSLNFSPALVHITAFDCQYLHMFFQSHQRRVQTCVALKYYREMSLHKKKNISMRDCTSIFTIVTDNKKELHVFSGTSPVNMSLLKVSPNLNFKSCLNGIAFSTGKFPFLFSSTLHSLI